MSHREIQNLLNDPNTPAITDLRSGRNRTNQPSNSTSNDQSTTPSDAPTEDLSSIQQHDSGILQTSAYREISPQYEESPWGAGTSTAILDPELRKIRTSEDELQIQDSVDAQHEQLRAEVDWFRTDLKEEHDWKNRISIQYNRISTSIKSFIAKLALVGDGVDMSAIDKATELSASLDTAFKHLHAQAFQELPHHSQNNLRPSNLSVQFEQCERDSSNTRNADTLVHTQTDDSVFTPEGEHSISLRQDKSEAKLDSLEITLQQISIAQDELRESHLMLDETVSSINTKCKDSVVELSTSIQKIEIENKELKNDLAEAISSISSLRNAFKGLQTSVRENKKRISNTASVAASSTRSMGSDQPSGRPRISSAAMETQERNLKEIQYRILAITKINIYLISSEARIASLVDREAKILEKNTNLAYEKLTKYSDIPHMNKQLYQSLQNTLTEAAIWSQQLNQKYSDLNLFEIQSATKISIEVTKFEEQGCQSIFEFLRDFNACYRGRGNDQVKANQLWKKYLSSSIQADTETIKDDYQALQKHLLYNYGNIDCVTNCILRSVERSPKPARDNYRDRHTYLKKLLNALQKLQTVPDKSTIERKAWENSIFESKAIYRYQCCGTGTGTVRNR